MAFAAAGAVGAGDETAGLAAVSDLVAAELAAGVDSALLPSEDAGADAPADSVDPVLGSVGSSLFLPEPSLKSVTYQPVPFSWKPAAVSCFLKVALPQAGQTVNSGSDIFCKTSLACPQVSHL